MENDQIKTEQTQDEGAKQENGTYTEAQVQEMLQKETDRRVTAALAKQEAKFLEKIAEADKLAKMDEKQKSQYELETRMKELESKEREFNLMRNKVEASKVMASRGLPIEFTDYIVDDSAEVMLERIDKFDKAFKAAVADAVNKKIASPAPKTGTSSQTGLTRESFRKLSVAEQAEIYATNPQLYKELSGI